MSGTHTTRREPIGQSDFTQSIPTRWIGFDIVFRIFRGGFLRGSRLAWIRCARFNRTCSQESWHRPDETDSFAQLSSRTTWFSLLDSATAVARGVEFTRDVTVPHATEGSRRHIEDGTKDVRP
jgi:hypothetical protein